VGRSGNRCNQRLHQLRFADPEGSHDNGDFMKIGEKDQENVSEMTGGTLNLEHDSI
jgi:hypothetical protein